MQMEKGKKLNCHMKKARETRTKDEEKKETKKKENTCQSIRI